MSPLVWNILSTLFVDIVTGRSKTSDAIDVVNLLGRNGVQIDWSAVKKGFSDFGEWVKLAEQNHAEAIASSTDEVRAEQGAKLAASGDAKPEN